ncbi:DUF4834 domain-containing protein [Roseivirga seohaensis]|uniref:DUF4834 domain-containing protein n=1 Tax=Roseivirga seohaensis TaxID=1914963 RepID=UPI003BAB383D
MFFKFLFFVILIGWLIRSVLRFFVAGLTGQQRTAGARQQYTQQHRPEGKINVDYAPKNTKEKSSDNFRGGEYVDYEEVD